LTVFDLSQTDRLLTTTKQVRKRLDLTRPVDVELVLECIDIASAAPMGGNLERNRWMIIDDPQLKARIAEIYAAVGGPYLRANAEAVAPGSRQEKVIDSSEFLVEHLAEVPILLLAMRLDRPDPAQAAGFFGSVAPGIWSFQLAARSRGLGSTWTTFHLAHESEVAEMLGIPASVTQVALLPVAYYTGDTFHPAPRRPAREITYRNQWKTPVD
jgi:nitroreductase